MKMNFKKITAALAAAAVAVSMTVTAFADAGYDNGQGYTDPAADQGAYVDPSQQYTDPNATVDPSQQQYTDPNTVVDPTQQQNTDPNAAAADPTQQQNTDPNAAVVDPAQQPTEPVTETTTLTQTTYVPPEPTASPATVKLKVGEIKDLKFAVDIMVESPKKIANAQFVIEYDQEALRYESCQHNTEAGGMAVENSFDGKFVYNYVNPDGTAFEGSYCTVVFSIIDEKMTSSALHLTVNDLSDENAVTISCQTESAIVKYKGAPEEDDDSSYREVKLPLSKSPYTPEDMIASGDIVNVEIDNEDILTYADGKFTASAAGTAKVTIEYADGSVAKLMVIIEDDTSSSVAETTTVTTAAPGTEEKEESSNSLMFILIAVVVVIGIGIVIAEYFLIMKRRDPNDDEYDEYPEEEASEATNEGGVIRSGYDPNDQNPDAGYDDEYYDDEEYYDDDQPASDDNTQNKDE